MPKIHQISSRNTTTLSRAQKLQSRVLRSLKKMQQCLCNISHARATSIAALWQRETAPYQVSVQKLCTQPLARAHCSNGQLERDQKVISNCKCIYRSTRTRYGAASHFFRTTRGPKSGFFFLHKHSRLVLLLLGTF